MIKLLIIIVVVVAVANRVSGQACTDILCTDQYDPICGRPRRCGTLKTFGNSCQMGQWNCEHPKESKFDLKIIK